MKENRPRGILICWSNEERETKTTTIFESQFFFYCVYRPSQDPLAKEAPMFGNIGQYLFNELL